MFIACFLLFYMTTAKFEISTMLSIHHATGWIIVLGIITPFFVGLIMYRGRSDNFPND